MITPYKLLLKVPIIGTIVYIANSYAFRGDDRAVTCFAGIGAWFKILLAPLGMALFLAVATCWPMVEPWLKRQHLCKNLLSDFSKTPGELIVSVVPSLLGFGIGVYALIFALAPSILRQLDRNISRLKEVRLKSSGSALVVNADLAYPLIILLLALVIGVLQRRIANPWLVLAAWTFFWYALIVTIEIIGVLFGLGDQSLTEKLDGSKKPPANKSQRWLVRSPMRFKRASRTKKSKDQPPSS